MGSTVATDDATMLADQNVAKPIQRRYGNSATVIRSRASSGRGFVSFIVPSHVPFEVAVCKDIVANLLANDHSEPFREPVDRDLYPHYYKVIANPTDLGTIRIRLDQGGYQDWSALVTDMELLFNNCRTFNHPSQEVARLGRELELAFQLELDKLAGPSHATGHGAIDSEPGPRKLPKLQADVTAAANEVAPMASQQGCNATPKPQSRSTGKRTKGVGSGAGQQHAKGARPGPIRRLFENYMTSRANEALNTTSDARPSSQQARQDTSKREVSTAAQVPAPRHTKKVHGKAAHAPASAPARVSTLDQPTTGGHAAAVPADDGSQSTPSKQIMIPAGGTATPPAAVAETGMADNGHNESLANEGEEAEEDDSRLLDKLPRSTEAQKSARRARRAEQLRQWKQRTEKESREERMRKRRGEAEAEPDPADRSKKPRVRWREDLTFYSIFSHLDSDQHSADE